MNKRDESLEEAARLTREQEALLLSAFRRGRRGERYRMLQQARKVVSRWSAPPSCR